MYSLKAAPELLYILAQIQNFRNRGITYFRFNVSLYVLFRHVYAGVFPRTIYGYHSGMNAYLVARPSILYCMCKTIGKNLSDNRNRYLRNFLSLNPGDFIPPTYIFQDVFLCDSKQVNNIILINLHI